MSPIRSFLAGGLRLPRLLRGGALLGLAASVLAPATQAFALNPQPLPPGIYSPYGMRALNPQPLPPGIYASPYGMHALNPQPLPPGIRAFGRFRR